MLARRSLSPVRSFAATVVEPRPTGKVFAWASRIVFKKNLVIQKITMRQ